MKLSATTLRNIGYDYTINEHGDIEFLWIGHDNAQRAAIMGEIASRVEMLGYDGHDHSRLMDALYEQMFRIDIASCIINR